MRRGRNAARTLADPGGHPRGASIGRRFCRDRGLSRLRPAVAGLVLAVLVAVPSLAAACRWHCSAGAASGACHGGPAMAMNEHCAMRAANTGFAATQNGAAVSESAAGNPTPAFAAPSGMCHGRPCRQETPSLGPDAGFSAADAWQAHLSSAPRVSSATPQASSLPLSGRRSSLPPIPPPQAASPLALSGALRV